MTLERKLEQMGRELPTGYDPVDDTEFDTHVTDDVLRLMFTACHPVLSAEARVALTLRMVAGLTTEEIARAFVVPTADDGRADHPGQEGAGRGAACRSRSRSGTS